MFSRLITAFGQPAQLYLSESRCFVGMISFQLSFQSWWTLKCHLDHVSTAVLSNGFREKSDWKTKLNQCMLLISNYTPITFHFRPGILTCGTDPLVWVFRYVYIWKCCKPFFNIIYASVFTAELKQAIISLRYILAWCSALNAWGFNKF